MNIPKLDSNLAYASKANLIVNLNILKNLNIDSIIISLYLSLLEDMIQSHGLLDMVSDSQQPVIYSPSNEQLSTTDDLASPPSRHDSESLLLRSKQMYINMSTAASENYPHQQTSSSSLVSFSSTYPLSHTELYRMSEPEVYSGGDTGNSHTFVDADTFHSLELAVNGTAVLGSDNEDSTNFDHEIWNVFVSMFNQSQLPDSITEK
ncbi:hypothetical protein K7432_015937 [Basidiobolus ranarum]|uniref:Uncharacterized protein n=1 Tax=Basidiobolus ranarum TaxID=34480 RepID=A0ABR2WFL0_9FUNG